MLTGGRHEALLYQCSADCAGRCHRIISFALPRPLCQTLPRPRARLCPAPSYCGLTLDPGTGAGGGTVCVCTVHGTVPLHTKMAQIPDYMWRPLGDLEINASGKKDEMQT